MTQIALALDPYDTLLYVSGPSTVGTQGCSEAL